MQAVLQRPLKSAHSRHHHKSTLAVEELVDGFASSIARISIPWWCKQRNRLVTEEVRQRVTKRKMTILLHQ
jgi:hypothetical protein